MGNDKGISAQRLKSFIERIERLEEEKKALGADIKEIYAEAKSGGYDPKIMRAVVKIRKMDKAERQEIDALLEVYLEAVGGNRWPPHAARRPSTGHSRTRSQPRPAMPWAKRSTPPSRTWRVATGAPSKTCACTWRGRSPEGRPVRTRSIL